MCAAPFQPLKSPTRFTFRALGAHTAKPVPATPLCNRGAAPSTSIPVIASLGETAGDLLSMTLNLGYVASSAILLAIPGPTVLLAVSYALGYGPRSALAASPRRVSKRPHVGCATTAGSMGSNQRCMPPCSALYSSGCQCARCGTCCTSAPFTTKQLWRRCR